jgi:hypothetical protein
VGPSALSCATRPSRALAWRGLNKELHELRKSVARCDEEGSTLAYEIKVGLRTIESMLGADDEYLAQVKQAMDRS